MSLDRYQLNDTYRQDFVVSDPATGEAVTADAAPDVQFFEDGGTDPIYTPTAAEREAGRDGQYTYTATLSAANGFETGKTYNVYAVAVVGGATGKALIGTFKLGPVLTYAN
jgi:hypothetical protein